MRSIRLQLTAYKNELLWCSTAGRQHRLPTSAVTIGTEQVVPTTQVHNLGIFVNSDLVMRTHVQQTVSKCFAVLCQLRGIRHSVQTDVFQTLVVFHSF
jgi:hypothetical protein